jgi:hypothetical protein
VSACGHQFFYLARIDNFALSAEHNTPCAPALLEQLRELATLTYVHGKRSWRGECWGISKKEVTATQLGFYLLLLFLSPPSLSLSIQTTTSTTSRLCPPRPHNNKPFGQGEGEPFGRGEGRGAATVDAILQGRVGDATEEEKIRTTTTENE